MDARSDDDLAQPRRPRRDAARNRTRLLDEAERLFGEEGTSASLDELARRSGLSSATVYRHFPNREALFAALLERLGGVIDDALTNRVLAAPTAAKQLELIITVSAELLIEYPGYRPIIAALQKSDPTFQPSNSYVPIFEEILERAKAEGAVRHDIQTTDIQLLGIMVGSLGNFVGMKESGLWRRYAAIVIDGLRPVPTGSEPAPAPASDDLERFLGPEGTIGPWEE